MLHTQPGGLLLGKALAEQLQLSISSTFHTSPEKKSSTVVTSTMARQQLQKIPTTMGVHTSLKEIKAAWAQSLVGLVDYRGISTELIHNKSPTNFHTVCSLIQVDFYPIFHLTTMHIYTSTSPSALSTWTLIIHSEKGLLNYFHQWKCFSTLLFSSDWTVK